MRRRNDAREFLRQQERRLRERDAAAPVAGPPGPGEDRRQAGSVAAAFAAGSPPRGAVQPREEVGAATSAAGARSSPSNAVSDELLEQLRGKPDKDILVQSSARDARPDAPLTLRPARSIRRPARFNDFYV